MLHKTYRSVSHVTSEGVETRLVPEVVKVLAHPSSIRVPHEREATLQPGIRPFVRVEVGITIIDPRE